MSRFSVCISLGLAAAAVAGSAHAQAFAVEPGAAQAQEGLRRQEERSRDQQRELQPRADALTPAARGARVPDLPDEQPCFVVRDIALTGPDERLNAYASATHAF